MQHRSGHDGFDLLRGHNVAALLGCMGLKPSEIKWELAGSSRVQQGLPVARMS